MAVITKGHTFANGDQVTALKLNNLADDAAFASGAVDNVSTQLSSGAIIVKDGGVGTAKIADDSVTTTKIADAQIVTAKIADAQITTAKIANSNVTAAKIANSNVTTAKIANNAVSTAKLPDSAVTTAKINDSAVTTDKIADSNVTAAKLSSDALTAAVAASYPVGSIYINATNATNPATLLGFGTWVAFGAGKVPVGQDSSDTDFDTAEETGGAKTHTLTESELPSHTHGSGLVSINSNGGRATFTNNRLENEAERGTFQGDTDSTGGGSAHNNLQPYIVVYMWKRTA